MSERAERIWIELMRKHRGNDTEALDDACDRLRAMEEALAETNRALRGFFWHDCGLIEGGSYTIIALPAKEFAEAKTAQQKAEALLPKPPGQGGSDA